jgi:type IV pilus assembly protein PilC
MIFYYKAKSKSGEIFDGSMEGDDRFLVARELISQGNTPLSVFTKDKKYSDLSVYFGKFFAKVRMSEKIIFTRNLSGMLHAGLSLSRAISVLEKQTSNRLFKSILTSLKKEIDKGEPLSAGLEKFPKIFSRLFVSMVRAGEESGNLAGSLTEIGVNLEKSNNITKKVKGALMYPSVIICAMILIGILMFIFVVPTLAKTFNDLGTPLPASTRLVLGIGNFFSNHLFIAILGIFAIVFGLITLVRAKFMKPFFDRFTIKLPLIGNLIKELNTARTARTLSSLITSGVSITRSIEITEDVVQNMYYRRVLEKAKVAVEKGAPFSGSFKENSNLYPIMVGEMLEVGEETGKLSDMLLEVAIFYEEEVENKTRNLSTIIEPLLMVIIGAGVGFFAVSMITPLYSVLDNIK